MSGEITRLCADLRAEVAALRDLLASGTCAPALETPFMGWSVRDSIEHMVLIDRLATLSFSDPEAARAQREAFGKGTSQPSDVPFDRYRAIADYETLRLGILGWEQLLAVWDIGLDQLCDAAMRAGDGARVEWFGGSMRAPSLISARHMEVWSYGQDVFDAAAAERPDGERLRNVVEFGLKTFSFSFANRGYQVPASKPFVSLASPGGAAWEWNDSSSEDSVTGSARDFCLVVTQRRHVADTGLKVVGPVAQRWMAIAQAIAGPPMDGPAPGSAASRAILSGPQSGI